MFILSSYGFVCLACFTSSVFVGDGECALGLKSLHKDMRSRGLLQCVKCTAKHQTQKSKEIHTRGGQQQETDTNYYTQHNFSEHMKIKVSLWRVSVFVGLFVRK